MIDTNKTYTFSDGATFRIVPDEHPINPRKEFDHVGTMVCFHGRYDLGDVGHGFSESDQTTWEELEKNIRKQHRVLAILPLWLYDHSGISISTGRTCQWDSGRIGFIFTTRKALQKIGWKKEDRTEEKALEILRNEIEEYNTYLQGDIWCYDLENVPDGEDDSLSGIYSPDMPHVLEFLPEKYHEEIKAFDSNRKAA